MLTAALTTDFPYCFGSVQPTPGPPGHGLLHRIHVTQPAVRAQSDVLPPRQRNRANRCLVAASPAVSFCRREAASGEFDCRERFVNPNTIALKVDAVDPRSPAFRTGHDSRGYYG